MEAVVAIVGDLHTNSTVALCPPTFTLDDGGTYKASVAQRWIWRQWCDYWARVRAVQNGAPLYVILTGELADDLNHQTTQLVTRNPADMLRLSLDSLAPMLQLEPDGIFVLRGTEAHVGKGSHMDEEIARDIGAIGPAPEVFSHYHLRAEFGGVWFDVAHHPGYGGRRPWTRGNAANGLAADVLHRYAELQARGQRVAWPDLAIRGHIHFPADSGDNQPVRGIIHPSWQLNTSFGHKLGGGWLPIGGLIARCRDGQYQLDKCYYRWPVQQLAPAWRQT